MAEEGRIDIRPELVRRLLADQFPQWAALTVEPVQGGWDNRSFRLGDGLVARLPSASWYAGQAGKEHLWLPRLAPELPLPVPVSIGLGRSSELFPWPWSVRRWLPGRSLAASPDVDLAMAAGDLGAFLRALHRAPTDGGPEPGPHNFHRGGPVVTYDRQVRRALAELRGSIDVDRAAAFWEEALAASWSGPPVWVHGDVSAGNLLVEDGRLSGVIDFGGCAVGDPACDLAIAWTAFEGESRRAFRDALGLDDGAWARGRGWALWKALIVAAGLPGTDPDDADASRRVLASILSADD